MCTRKILLSFLIIAGICLTGLASASEKPNQSPRKIMNSYRWEKGFISLSFPVFIAKIALSKEDQEVRDLLQDIRKIRILFCENAGTHSDAVKNCIDDFEAFFHHSSYVDLVNVIDNKDNIKIKGIPDKNCFQDMVLIVSDEHELVVVHLIGSVNLEAFRRLIGEKEIVSL
ncbi:MAG: DUF4252 domain-containing protein [Bacteroidales bacterium]|nr:DUF4252 domain-containing protein [Bacteroidales bacterium]MBN2763219.1 DUF4252 domain-containing protein [Bacteroidales bacterium]